MALNMGGAPGYSGRPLHNQSIRMSEKVEVTITANCWVKDGKEGESIKAKAGDVLSLNPVTAFTLIGGNKAVKGQVAKKVAKKKVAAEKVDD